MKVKKLITGKNRKLWLKLNAEHQIAWERGLTYFSKETQEFEPTHQALNVRSFKKALQIAENQLNSDEENGKLRFTLEEYLMLTTKQLEAIRLKKHQEWCKDTFPEWYITL